MGGGASKSKKNAAASPKADRRHSANSKANTPTPPPPAAPVAAQRNQRADARTPGSENSTSDSSPRGRGSPGESRGFNNPQPARRDPADSRTGNRQTRMVGAEDMNGVKEDLDERPFHQEKVNRVPTKALLKPPKNPNSMIADPDDDYDIY